MNRIVALLAAVLWSGVAIAAQAPDTPVVTGPNMQQVPIGNLYVTPTGGTQTTLGAALANSTNSSVTPTGAPTAVPLPTIASQQGVLLDAFRLAADTDDTASMTRAVAAGVPILLGPKTYTINNFSTGAVTNFVLQGVKGRSIIQRTSASGSNFFTVGAANVAIDGVTFDSNKASVTANQWGVLLAAGGQTVTIQNSVFKNNSGTLGSCLALTSTGPAAGGSFIIENNEVTGCTFDSLFVGSVSNGTIRGNNIHDNTSFGIFAGSLGAASATNYLTNVVISHNIINRNTNGLQLGGYAPPYAFGTPAATYVAVTDNVFQDNSGYGASIEADYAVFSHNLINKSSSGVTATGGFDALSRWLTITDNVINMTGSIWGIDCGGSIEVIARGNIVTMDRGIALNTGGNLNSHYVGNKLILTGTAFGITNLAVEGSSAANIFPTLSSGTIFEGNTIDMNGASVNGMAFYDNAGGMTGTTPNIVRNNHFIAPSGSPSTSQYLTWFGSSISIFVDGNDVNGGMDTFIDPNGSGDVLFAPVFLGGTIFGISSTTNIRSILTQQASTTGSGATILYAYPTSGGSGYTAATVLTANGTGGGSGWTGSAQIYNGAIIGVRTLTSGSGYSGTLTITASDSGGGTGAVIAVGNKIVLPAYANLTYASASTHLLQIGGGFISLSTTMPFVLSNTTVVNLQAIQAGTFWKVTSYTVPELATANLPTCNATSSGAWATATDALAPTYGGILAGSGAVRAPSVCNATNWITH
jgi:hypothetical protein